MYCNERTNVNLPSIKQEVFYVQRKCKYGLKLFKNFMKVCEFFFLYVIWSQTFIVWDVESDMFLFQAFSFFDSQKRLVLQEKQSKT